MAAMPMPEAAVYEHSDPLSGKHQIRPAREFPSIKAEPEAGSVEQRADGAFRVGVAAADAGHHPAARGRINDVGQATIDSDNCTAGCDAGTDRAFRI